MRIHGRDGDRLQPVRQVCGELLRLHRSIRENKFRDYRRVIRLGEFLIRGERRRFIME